jgi:hypothetical protein
MRRRSTTTRKIPNLPESSRAVRLSALAFRLCLLLVFSAGNALAQGSSAAARSSSLLVSPVSGVYAEDQVLSAETAEPRLTLRYSFRDTSGAEGPWIPFRGPIALTAVPGEQREYRVILKADSDGVEQERRELAIRIDKRIPPPPRVLPEPGTYWDPFSLRLEARQGDAVFYSIQGDVVRAPLKWTGSEITVGALDQKAQYVVQAWSMDGAGNRSRIVSSRYVLDTRAPELDVLSPVQGTFANPQTLALSFRGMQWVRYTDDGSDPAVNGIPYTGPTTMRRQGTTTIRVAGQPRAGKRPLVRREVTVTYTPSPGTGLLLDTDSGVYPRGISPKILSSPPGSVYYTLWEKTPTESDMLASAGIEISANTGGLSPLTLRLRSLGASGEWGTEYRYFYYLGLGAVTPPVVAMTAAEPVQGPARAQVTAAEDTLLSVALDGASPDPRAPAAASWVDLRPAAGSDSVLIRARALNGSGLQSPVTERRISTAALPRTAPAFSFAAVPPAGAAVLSSPLSAKSAVVYEVTSDGAEPAAPGPDSARLSGPLFMSLPFGMTRTFKVRLGVRDDAGHVVSSSETAGVTINRKPPDRPSLAPPPGSVLDEPAVLAIGSPAKVFFALSSDGTSPKDPDPVSSPASTFLALPGVDGSVTTYRLKLLAVDAAGNATEVYGPLLYTVDLRPPRIPALSQIADGGKYNSRQLSPVVGESAWNVRYTASSDGSVPPDPDLNSSLLTSATVFAGEDGAVTTWHVKLLAISHSGKRVGEKKAISFVIDLKPPEVPKLSGIPPGGRVARPVVLAAEASPADEHLFYTISTGEADPGDPVLTGTAFPATLAIDVPEDVRRDFTVRIASVDEAGNRSLYDRRYKFTIDRELPDDPDVHGVEEGAIYSRPATLTFESPQPAVVYEMTDDGSMPRLPTASSASYSGPLLLAGKSGTSVTYRLLARSFNDLGTASRAGRLVTVTIDRTLPLAPSAPVIQFSPENPGIAYLSWAPPLSGRILYRLRSGSSDPPSTSEFLPYEAPVSILVDPAGGATIAGEALTENSAGARSSSAPFSIGLSKKLLPPVFRGARDGVQATQKIELHASAAFGEVRYEVSTDGSYPPAVTSSSPVFPDPLVLGAADGQTVNVRVAARTFDPTGAAIPSDQAEINATIDRTPPDPPVASGIEDGGYYQEGRSVSLLSAEGAIYVALTTSADPVIPAQTDANKYSLPLALDPRPGQSVTYHIVAFSVDAAGNRSREIRAWTVTIDQKIVYAAPAGNDYADGSRGAPVKSIRRALQIASSTARKTVFFAAGDYPLDSPLTVQEDVSLAGGLDPDTWQPLGFERWSTVRTSAPWRGGSDFLLSVTAGKVSIKGVEFTNGPVPVAALLSISGGALSLQQVTVNLKGPSGGQAVSVSGGTVSVLDCTMQAGGAWKGSFISATGGSLTVSGSRFAGPPESTDFAGIELRDTKGTDLKGVEIDPGTGQRTRGIRAMRSQLSISGSRIESGAGAIEAVALDVSETVLSLENADVATSPGARSPVAILASSSRVSISGSRIKFGGTTSAVGVSARGGDLVLMRSIIRGAPTSEYLALMRLEDARSLIANSLLLGSAAGQSVGIQVKGGSADILNNTLVLGTGKTLTAGLLVHGDRVPRVVNNIITRKGAETGTAISILDARNLLAPRVPKSAEAVILSNIFGGWNRLLRIDYAPELSIPQKTAATPEAFNAADGDAFNGNIAGNKVEPADASFKPGQTDGYKLARGSVSLDAGTDLSAAGGPGGTGDILLRTAREISADFLGNPRPAPIQLDVPGPPRGWDIGAYEFSE